MLSIMLTIVENFLEEAKGKAFILVGGTLT